MNKNFETTYYIFRSPLILFIIHLLAMASGAYQHVPKLDNIFHFCGGMSIAAATQVGIMYAQKQKWLGNMHPFIQFIVITGIVALAAVCWEFLEFSMDHIVGTHMQGNLVDTLSDLLLGLLGGALMGILSRHKAGFQ